MSDSTSHCSALIDAIVTLRAGGRRVRARGRGCCTSSVLLRARRCTHADLHRCSRYLHCVTVRANCAAFLVTVHSLSSDSSQYEQESVLHCARDGVGVGDARRLELHRNTDITVSISDTI